MKTSTSLGSRWKYGVVCAAACLAGGFGCLLPAAAAPLPALVFHDPTVPGSDAALDDVLTHTLTTAGYAAQEADVDALLAAGALDPAHCALLVLPDARSLPAPLAPVVTAYLQRGGDVIVLGAPAWGQATTVKRDGQWQTADADAAAQALHLPEKPFLDFESDFPVSDLVRETDADTSPVQVGLEPTNGGPDQVAGALHVTVPQLTGWDMWRTPDLPASPFGPGQTMTVFSAKGGPNTHSLAVEWDDSDGSRWIATVPLTTQWQQFTLTPADFHAWQASAAQTASVFDPAHANRFKAGLDLAHTGQADGSQEYWIAAVGTADASAGASGPFTPPVFETLSPAYKFSPIHGKVTLATSPEQALVTPLTSPVIDSALSDIESAPPRAESGGFDKGRYWRWEPLLTAHDSQTGQWRGTPASLFFHKPDPGQPDAGGVWVSFAIGDPAFYLQDSIQTLIGDIARRLQAGLFLLDGGASSETLLQGQSVRLGATVMNMNTDPQTVEASVTVTLPGVSAPLWSHRWPLTLTGRETAKTPDVSWTLPLGKIPRDGCVVTTELSSGGTIVDRTEQRLYLWYPPAVAQYVTAGADGHFHLNGALWRPFGVNYAPSSGIAQETDDLYQHWLEPAAYAPETVERDLAHIQDLGFNAVSIWVYPDEGDWQNLLDFLRRCSMHNLKVSLMLAPDVSSPDAADSRAPLIHKFLLPQNDTLFAYEIAWEPEFGDHDKRKSMDTDWQTWVTAQYGSVAAAETKWQEKIPRDSAGAVTNPSDADMSAPAGLMSAVCIAYRRFLDDWLTKHYAPIVQRLHTIDPNHLVSFRMNHAGDPTDTDGTPYTFEGLAGAVDYLAPEGYGRVGDHLKVIPGMFTTAYARAVAPGKPMLWAEVGTSVWSDATQSADPDKLKFQGQFYEDFLQMATVSGADGLFFWWYPGGYRVGEGSDYGLLNPDGTDRPAAESIRRDGPAFLQAPAPPPPDVTLTFDRNMYANGLVGVYNALGPAFWTACSQGKHPGLRSTAGDGGKP